MNKFRTLAAGSFAALLAGCTVGPDYVRPDVETPAAYKEIAAWKPAQPQDEADRGNWWEVFGDAELNALASQVEVSNQTLRAAEARFRQAEALIRVARAAWFPLVTGTASAVRNAPPGAASGQSSAPRTTDTLSLDASWELDVWGRVRRSVEATEAGAQASAADVAAARLSAQAALVQNYLQLRIADIQRALLDDATAAYAKSLELVQNRYAAGVASKSDVAQAQTQLRTTQAQALDVGIARAQLEHAIAVLIGKPPSEFSIAPAAWTATTPVIPPGLPSELLERRPDIAGAERRVASANAQIGVATAAYYPSLTLSASAGFQSASFANWLIAPNRFWALGPALAQILFDAGQRRAITDQAMAAHDETVAVYRQTVLTGFQEVEDNLAGLRILEEEAQVQDEAVRAARESVALTTNQYKAGIVNYLAVVVVQAAALANEQTAAGILGRRLVAAVQLIKALGGGWSAADLPPPQDTSRFDLRQERSGGASRRKYACSC